MICKRAITKLQAILIAIIIIVAAAVGTYYISTSPEQSITVATFGGIVEESLTNHVVRDFEEETGINVEYFVQASSAETTTKILAEKGRPTIDVFIAGAYSVLELKRADLLYPMTEDTVPNLKYIRDDGLYLGSELEGYTVGLKPWSFGWVIYPDAIPEEMPPFNHTNEWFFDSRLEGMLAMPSPTWATMMYWFLYLAGVNASDFTKYPNADPAFELMEKLAPNMRFVYSSTAELASPFEGKEICGALMGLGETKSLVDVGIPLVPIIDMFPIASVSTGLSAIKGTGKEDLALQFINYMLEPERAANWCYGCAQPTTLKDPPAPPAELVTYLPSPDELARAAEHGHFPGYVAANLPTWSDRFDSEIIPLVG